MKRTASAFVLLAALSGCMSTEHNSPMPGGGPSGVSGCFGGGGAPPMVPGVQAAWGEPFPMCAPYASTPPNNYAARAMLNRSVPLDLVQGANPAQAGRPSEVVQASYNPGASPAGGLPGTVMPTGGVMMPPGVPPIPGMAPGLGCPPQGAVAAACAPGIGEGTRFPTQRTEVRFSRPSGMKVSWFATCQDGRPGFATTQVDTPGRYNFPQGAIYRLRLSEIPGWPQAVLYPTLEVKASTCHTDPFLAHSAVPVEFTNEDFRQVAEGNLVVKVIYLPNPQFQGEVGVPGGLAEIDNTRLEPGTDPVLEAQRRGTILLIIRIGNIDLELNNSPPMSAPSPFACPPGPPPLAGGGYGMPGPGLAAGGMPGMGNPMMMAGPGPMGPNPALMGPSGPMAPRLGPPAGYPQSFPVMQPNMVPPINPAGPGQASAGSGLPVTQLPDASGVKRADFTKAAPPAGLPELPAQGQAK